MKLPHQIVSCYEFQLMNATRHLLQYKHPLYRTQESAVHQRPKEVGSMTCPQAEPSKKYRDTLSLINHRTMEI
jgi:hypothetical protein